MWGTLDDRSSRPPLERTSIPPAVLTPKDQTPMRTAPLRRIPAIVGVLVLAVAGSLAATPALAAPTSDPVPQAPAAGAFVTTSTPTFSWSAATSDYPGTLRYQVKVTDSGGIVRGDVFETGTTWSPTVPLPDGAYSWQVRGVDRIASRGPWSAPIPFTVDTAAPAVAIAAPGPGLVVAPGTVIPFTGTISDANPFRTFLGVDSRTLLIDESGLTTLSSSIDTTGMASGVHTIKFEARDAAGNKSGASVAAVTFTVDGNAPTVVITAPADGSYVKPGSALTLNATVTDLGSFSYAEHLDGLEIGSGTGDGLVNTARAIDTSTWTDGSSHVLSVTADDDLGNAGGAAAVTVHADARGPVVTFTAPSPSTKHSGTMTVSGTVADAGSGVATLDVRVRAADPTTGVCDGPSVKFDVPFAPDGSWAIDIDATAFADGVYCVISHATDALGNGNGQSTRVRGIEFDNSAPTGSFAPMYPNGFHLSVDHFSWGALSDPNGVTYEVALGAHPNVDAGGLMTTGLQLLGSTTATSLDHDVPTGPHFWQVRAIDALGNATPWTSPRGFQVVGVPEILFPTEGLVFAESSLTAQWTPVFGVGGVDYYEIEYGLDRDHDGILSPETRTVDGGTWVAGVPITRTQTFPAPEYEGPLSIRVRAVYNISFGGSVYGPWSSPVVSYVRDTAKPTITIDAPGSGASFPGDVDIPVTITGTDPAGISRLVANLYAGDGSTFLGPIGSTPSNGALGTTATRTWDIPAGLAEGAYVIRASATDAADKTTATSTPFTIDDTRPTITIDAPAGGSAFTGSAPFDVTVTGTDAVGLQRVTANLYDGANSTFLGPIGTIGLSGPTSHTQTWSFDPSGLAEGSYTIRSSARDLAGNIRTTSIGFTIDRTRPTVTIDAPAPGSAHNADITVTVTGVDPTGMRSIAANLYGASNSGPLLRAIGQSTAAGATTNSASWVIPISWFTADGTYTIRAGGFDVAGNNRTVTAQFVVDTTGPSVTLISPADGTVSVVDDVTLDWADAEAGADYELRSSVDPSVDGSGMLDSLAASTTLGTSRFDVVDAPEATYYWQVRATDPLGNVGPWSPVWSVTIDLPAPATPSAPGGGAAAAPPATGGLVTLGLEDEPADDDPAVGESPTDDGDDASTGDPEATASTSPGDGSPILLVALLTGLGLLLLLVLLLALLRRRRAA